MLRPVPEPFYLCHLQGHRVYLSRHQRELCGRLHRRWVTRYLILLTGICYLAAANATSLAGNEHHNQLHLHSTTLALYMLTHVVAQLRPHWCCHAGGAHFPWWAGVILGVGLALILAAVLLTLAVCYVRRLQRRNSELASSVRDVESKVGCMAVGTLSS